MAMTETLTIESRPTPLGDFLLVADQGGTLCAADFADCEDRLRRLLDRKFGPTSYHLEKRRIPAPIAQAIESYFAGELGAIDRVPIFQSGSAFQKKVWSALRRIQPGHVTSYGDIAKSMGRPDAARAVGHANAANPFCIVVPCHRLVGAGGDLTGYSGGLERKRWLLNHETKHAGNGRA